MATKNWTVVRKRNGRENVLFDGNENDARTYVANNFPRVHVDPTSADNNAGPDVLLKSPDGDYSGHFGPDNWQDTDEDGVVAVADNDDDDEPTPAKKTAAKKTAAPAFSGKG